MEELNSKVGVKGSMVKKALLIGINYIGTPDALSGCINDVGNIRDILSSKYKFDSIRVLTDNTPVKPTLNGIKAAIADLVYGTKAGDTVVFHYSGHGSNITDKNSDETDGRDEVLVPLDYATAGIIPDDWLYQNLCQKIPKGASLWCFTDCCHSGSIMDLQYVVTSKCVPKKSSGDYICKDWTDSFSVTQERTKSPCTGSIVCFSGCMDPQTSADATIDSQAQGAFTSCLIKFLKRDTRNVSVKDVLKEINARLDIGGFKQNSQLSLSDLSKLESVFVI